MGCMALTASKTLLTGEASQVQQPSGPDRARKSAEPQPGAKRKRSAEPQPAAPSWQGGSAQGTPHSTEEGDDHLENKRRASEVSVVCCSDIVACDCMEYAQSPLLRGMGCVWSIKRLTA